MTIRTVEEIQEARALAAEARAEAIATVAKRLTSVSIQSTNRKLVREVREDVRKAIAEPRWTRTALGLDDGEDGEE